MLFDTTFEMLCDRSIERMEWEQERLKKASVALKSAIDQTDKVTDFLADTLGALDEDMPEYDRVASVLHDFENMACELKEVLNRCERG